MSELNSDEIIEVNLLNDINGISGIGVVVFNCFENTSYTFEIYSDSVEISHGVNGDGTATKKQKEISE